MHKITAMLHVTQFDNKPNQTQTMANA